MKIIKDSFESLLRETENIYIRIDSENGVRTLVAGGIDQNGTWIEYPSELKYSDTAIDITRYLKVMIYLIQEEKKKWGIERPHHLLIREVGLSLN
ncbi:hypothetical protein [Ekhidna sp.]|jgi:hypothetical protein|uniref:hypothetical protein n=1 Tax=Ekhidna sp. TaxID=2608089 RepID=UPI0032F03FCA